MSVVIGRCLLGHIDVVPGHFFVATECVHISYIPVVPVQSWIVTSEDPSTQSYQGVKIEWQRRSLIAAYVRSLSIALAWVLLIGGILKLLEALGAPPGARPSALIWAGCFLGSFLGYVSFRVSWRQELATPERARELARRIQMPEPMVELLVLPGLARATPSRPARWLQALVLLVGLAGLGTGLAARMGKVNLGTEFPSVTPAEAPSRLGSWQQGYVEMNASFDLDHVLYTTGIDRPVVSRHPSGRTIALDAAALADPARLADLQGARVEVAASIEPGALELEHSLLNDVPGVMCLAPVAGTERRVWVVSRWFRKATEAAEVKSFLAGRKFSGVMTRVGLLHENMMWGAEMRVIEEVAQKAGVEPPDADAFLIQVGGRYQDSPDAGAGYAVEAYVPVLGAPEPLYVELKPEDLPNLRSPVKGHLSRDGRISRDVLGFRPKKEKEVILLDVPLAQMLENQREYRTNAALGTGSALTLVALFWFLLP